MSVPNTDKPIYNEILATFEGDPALGTFDNTITSSTAISIPLSIWDNWKRPLNLGPYHVEGLLAEWLTLQVESNASSGTPLTLTLWLACATGGITPRVTSTFDPAADSVSLIINFNCLSTDIDLSGTKDVQLMGYTSAGEVDVKFISLTYSPK